jgi:hypothetical protein
MLLANGKSEANSAHRWAAKSTISNHKTADGLPRRDYTCFSNGQSLLKHTCGCAFVATAQSGVEDVDAPIVTNALPIGTRLERYVIEEVLGASSSKAIDPQRHLHRRSHGTS